MVIAVGCATFVSGMNLVSHPDPPERLCLVDALVIKVRLASATIGTASSMCS